MNKYEAIFTSPIARLNFKETIEASTYMEAEQKAQAKLVKPQHVVIFDK